MKSKLKSLRPNPLIYSYCKMKAFGKIDKMPSALKGLCILWVERYSEVSTKGSEIN